MLLRYTSLISLICLSLFACEAEHPILVEDVWVRKIQPSQSVTAGYLTLTNTGIKDNQLLSVSSPAFDAVEMHEMAIDDKGVMRMRKSGPLDIAVRESVVLKPGSFHLMLIGPKYKIAAGNDIPLSLNFQEAGDQTVAARVRDE